MWRSFYFVLFTIQCGYLIVLTNFLSFSNALGDDKQEHSQERIYISKYGLPKCTNQCRQIGIIGAGKSV